MCKPQSYRVNPSDWTIQCGPNRGKNWRNVRSCVLIMTNEYYYLVWDLSTNYPTIVKLTKEFELIASSSINYLKNPKLMISFAKTIIELSHYNNPIEKNQLIEKDLKTLFTHREPLVREIVKILL